MKLEQGDAFERSNRDWIRENLASYEPVWSAFIGHSGAGWPCEMPGLDNEAETDRKYFYQAHYSFARSMRKIAEITQQFDASSGEIRTYESFEEEIERLFQYMSHVGHVRDMFKIIDEALDCHGHLYHPLQEFYAQRSHVLHGPRLPVRIEDGLLKIPKIGGANEVFGDWTNKANWDSIPEKSFVFIRDFVVDTTDTLNGIVCDLHARVFDAATKRFDGKKIIELESKPDFSSDVSGLTFAPAISAFNPRRSHD